MTLESDGRAFYVVQFIEFPFEGIANYVCVPYNWLVKLGTTGKKVLVAYPINENPFHTRDRVEREERRHYNWKLYMAVVKYESNNYEDAKFWIASRSNNGPLVKEEQKKTDTQPKVTLAPVRSHHKQSSNNKRPTPQKTSKSLKISADLLDESLLMRSVEKQSSLVTQVRPQSASQVINMYSENNRDQTVPNRSFALEKVAVDSKHVLQNNNNPSFVQDLKKKRSLPAQEKYQTQNRKVIWDDNVSTGDILSETKNNVYSNGDRSDATSIERSTTAQNSASPNDQAQSTVALFNQMGSILRSTFDMYKNLQPSICNAVSTYNTLMNTIKDFNVVRNSTSSASPPSNVTPEVPRAPKERDPEETARTNSCNENQQNNNVSRKSLKKKHNLGRFVLSSKYNAHDTRWTLKYRENLPGLIELVPQSGVYVSYAELVHCQQVSKDCKTLACRLLQEIFNNKALSVCLSMTEEAQASENANSNPRPKLDENACSVLIIYVLKYGLQCGWKTDLQPILRTLHTKIRQFRFKYGAMAGC